MGRPKQSKRKRKALKSLISRYNDFRVGDLVKHVDYPDDSLGILIERDEHPPEGPLRTWNYRPRIRIKWIRRPEAFKEGTAWIHWGEVHKVQRPQQGFTFP